eukprot:TRINITY_DN11933_c0_g2_i1.p1 TRINITY_DN11933_c0_g2~~TRINITY_DN11933_c0_g2_i1.p1  ORF type:complete len:194 (-),score=57.41 TRINITY_DN11933_c0_g2_i1:107-688(-)
MVAAWLLEDVASLAGARDLNGLTPLIIAAQLGAAGSGFVRLLATHAGADINTAAGNKLTALMFASKGGNEAAVQALLQAGADVTAVDGFGQTAAHLAARHGCVGASAALCASMQAMQCRDDDGDLPIHTAVRGCQEPGPRLQTVAHMLAAHPALANAKDFSDSTPLHAAVRCAAPACRSAELSHADWRLRRCR